MRKMEMLLDELKELKRRLDENDDMAQLLEKQKIEVMTSRWSMK